jgi:HD-GYP domain-containing protein (c-di-GMP phosphodiesterase class II)
MEEAKNFITSLMVAASNCSLYTKEHDAFDDLAKKAYSKLSGIIEHSMDIMLIEDELIINKTPARDLGIHGMNLIKRLKRKGVSRINIMQGITVSEIKQLIIELSGSGKGLKNYPHIKSGAVDVSISSSESASAMGDYSAIEGTEKVKEVIHAASPFKKLNVKGLEEVVVNFISTFRREASILKYLSPVKSFDEYTYTHATNVAVLSVLQAQSLGINSDILHEIGISGLLHDSGKMYIPKEILEKKGKLDDREFAEVQKHTLHGARYLVKIRNLPRIAPIIAFEHHMKYDGSGYPKLSMNGNKPKQHIYSQIVAIADFFDALRSNRPYRKGMELDEIFVLMKKSEGKDFNPFLVDNFIRLMQKALTD